MNVVKVKNVCGAKMELEMMEAEEMEEALGLVKGYGF